MRTAFGACCQDPSCHKLHMPQFVINHEREFEITLFRLHLEPTDDIKRLNETHVHEIMNKMTLPTTLTRRHSWYALMTPN
jgi:hypothetical protein